LAITQRSVRHIAHPVPAGARRPPRDRTIKTPPRQGQAEEDHHRHHQLSAAWWAPSRIETRDAFKTDLPNRERYTSTACRFLVNPPPPPPLFPLRPAPFGKGRDAPPRPPARRTPPAHRQAAPLPFRPAQYRQYDADPRVKKIPTRRRPDRHDADRDPAQVRSPPSAMSPDRDNPRATPRFCPFAGPIASRSPQAKQSAFGPVVSLSSRRHLELRVALPR